MLTKSGHLTGSNNSKKTIKKGYVVNGGRWLGLPVLRSDDEKED